VIFNFSFHFKLTEGIGFVNGNFSMVYQLRQFQQNITRWMLSWCGIKNWGIR